MTQEAWTAFAGRVNKIFDEGFRATDYQSLLTPSRMIMCLSLMPCTCLCVVCSQQVKMVAIQKEMDEVWMPKIGAEAKAFSANYPTLNLAVKQKTLFIPRGGDNGGVRQEEIWYMELQIIPGAAGGTPVPVQMEQMQMQQPPLQMQQGSAW